MTTFLYSVIFFYNFWNRDLKPVKLINEGFEWFFDHPECFNRVSVIFILCYKFKKNARCFFFSKYCLLQSILKWWMHQKNMCLKEKIKFNMVKNWIFREISKWNNRKSKIGVLWRIQEGVLASFCSWYFFSIGDMKLNLWSDFVESYDFENLQVWYW